MSNKRSNETLYRPPSQTIEGRENQLIALAVDLAEQKLRDGTASNQVILHYLKLATTREQVEREILERQKELITAKTESLNASKNLDEIYLNAINAMREYGGGGSDE